MKTDFYTKAVLTAIAVFLALNFFKDTTLVTPAQASLPAPAVATQNSGVMDVNIVKIDGMDVFTRGVKFEGKEYAILPTSLEKVDLSSAISVSVVNGGGGGCNLREPIDVRLVDYAGDVARLGIPVYMK